MPGRFPLCFRSGYFISISNGRFNSEAAAILNPEPTNPQNKSH
jgi:hypothetical protein